MNLKRVAWVLLSAALHLVVVVLMLQAIFSPRSFVEFFRPRDRTIVPEHITYILPTQPDPEGASAAAPPPAPAPAPAGVTVPPAVQVVPPAAAVDTGGGAPVRTPGAGAGGVGGVGAPPAISDPGQTALVPPFKDQRVWAAPPPLPPVEPSRGVAGIQQSIDSAVAARLDSLSRIRDPNDWTVGEGKGKFGIDPKWLHLGPVKIPTALLALIPMDVQANPNARENARTLGVMAAEARAQGVRTENTQSEIKSIADRLNKQRDARRAAGGGGSGGSGGG